MQLNLADKHVVVTGASSGIGAGIAHAFAEEGSRVTLMGRDEQKLQMLSERMHGGGRHTWYAADLMGTGDAEKTINDIVVREGRPDILIHNIGGSQWIEDPLAPVGNWLEIWRLNIGIAIEINNIVVPLMRKAGWGRIVMISSIDSHSKMGAPAYAAAKAYLNGYIRTVAWRIAKHGIVLSGILPGPVLASGNSWDIRLRKNKSAVESFIEKRMPCSRLGSPDDIWPFVLLLASPVNTWAIGSLLDLDGGLHDS